MEQKWGGKLAEVGEMREELQRQINELRHSSDPLRHSIGETNTTMMRQKSEVEPLYCLSCHSSLTGTE